MQVEDFPKYMKLAKIINNSWGTGSVPQANKPSSQSIRFTMRDDKLLKGQFMMIVNVPNTPQFAQEMKERFMSQALAMFKGAIEEMVARFADQNHGEVIRLKMLDNSVIDGMEFLTNAQYNPTKRAYFRVSCLVSVD